MTTQVVARIADTLFVEIDSFTYSNITYDLTVDACGHVESCNCPDYRIRKAQRPNGCKHMRALQAQINAQKEAEKRALNERIQAEARAIVSKRFAELEKQRDEARAYGGFSILK